MTVVTPVPAATIPASEPGPGPDDVETAELPKDGDILAEAADLIEDVAEREFDPADVAAMDALDAPRRLLLVHAHPDDETIGTGATMAHYAFHGAQVTLVTCTRGERGEVVDDGLKHLEGDHRGLAERRVFELAAAMEALGVSDHRFLDDCPLAGEDPATTAAVRYEDSGMVWGPGGRVAVAAPDAGSHAFATADLQEAAARLAGVIRSIRPQVVVTYEATGGYGHPDHVRAHDVTLAAIGVAADPAQAGGGSPSLGSEPWEVAKVYEIVVPRSVAPAELMGEDGTGPGMVVPDEEVTAVVDAPTQLAAKTAALRAHASQLHVRTDSGGGPQMSVAHDLWIPVTVTESYRLRPSSPATPAPDSGGVESDLFAGLTL